jgi:predicted ATPase/DNA-binding SARP family transcriptional activator
MARLELSFLGPFQVRLDGQPVTGFEADKVRALLVYLAVESQRLHRREQLATLFWPGWPDASARTSLRNALSNLRAAIGDVAAEPPFLLITRETIQFNSDSSYTLDTLEFEKLIQASQATVEQLQIALDLYRGGFLEGFTLKDCPAFDDWSLAVREQLQRQASTAFSRLADLYEKDKAYEKAIACTRKRLTLEPWQEDAHRQLMRLLAASGQRPATLAQFEICKRSLKSELGVEPSAETVRLYESIRDSQPSEPAPAKAHPHNLPVQLTSFIGREKEIARVKNLLTVYRLVTLTGAGGTGKSRLSLQIASELLEEFPDGVCLVELAPLSDPERVPLAVARALGLHETTVTEAVSLLENFLEAKHLLLIFDNCEHLIETCAKLADSLLHTCPNIILLASSREALGIEGEASFRVPPLSFPQAGIAPEELAQYEAIRLFVERAETASLEFALSPQNAQAVTQICQRLDGIPLAIELAAARVKLLRVEEIAARLDDRFRLLTGGSRAALPRYQTLRASIDWSYALLSPAEEALLQRLSVFAGGWFLEAAEYVGCGEGIESCDVLDLLGQLVNKSLVSVDAEAVLETRYRMLETIRQFAHEKLVETWEARQVRDRHLKYFVDLAERVEHKIRGPDQTVITAMLDADLENLRLALDWSLEGKDKPGWTPDPGFKLASGLLWFWNSQSLFNFALEWLEHLLKAEANSTGEEPVPITRAKIRAKAIRIAGYLAMNAGDIDKATAFSEQSHSLFKSIKDDGKEGLAYAIWNLGHIAFIKGDLSQSEKLMEECLEIFKEAGDRFGEGESYMVFGLIALSQRKYEQANRYYEMNLALRKEIGDQDGAAYMLLSLGNVSCFLHKFDRARLLMTESQQVATAIKNSFLLQWGSYNLGLIDWIQGKYVQAFSHINEMMSISRQTADIYSITYGLYILSSMSLSQGNLANAQEFLEESLSTSLKKDMSHLLCGFGALALAEGNLEQAADDYSKVLEGKFEDVYISQEAIAHYGLGKIAYKKGNLDYAKQNFHKAIGNWAGLDWLFWNDELALEGLSFLSLSEKQTERAARLLGATEGWHQNFKFTRTPLERQERESAISFLRQALGEEAFEIAWQEGQAMPLEQTIEYARQQA